MRLSIHVMLRAMQELATAQPGHDASMAPQLNFTHPGVSYPLSLPHLQELVVTQGPAAQLSTASLDAFPGLRDRHMILPEAVPRTVQAILTEHESGIKLS